MIIERGYGGERGFLKKAWQKLLLGEGHGYSLCKSDCAPIWFRPRHQEIVRERLRGRIRRLFGVGASIRVEMRGERGDVRFNFVGWTSMGKNFPSQNHTFSIPQRGILPLQTKLYPAIAPRRRRIPSGAARERSSHVLDGTKLVSKPTCTN